MTPHQPDMGHLFAQLGLSSDAYSVAHFMQRHTTMSNGVALHEALSWTPSQAAFLREAIALDVLERPFITAGMAEGNGKWLTLSRDQAITNTAVGAAMAHPADAARQAANRRTRLDRSPVLSAAWAEPVRSTKSNAPGNAGGPIHPGRRL